MRVPWTLAAGARASVISACPAYAKITIFALSVSAVAFLDRIVFPPPGCLLVVTLMTSTSLPCDTWSPEEHFTRGTDIILSTGHAPTTVPAHGLLSRAPSTRGEVCPQWIDRCRTDPASAAHRRQWLLAGSRDHPDPATSVDPLLTEFGIPMVPTVTYVSTLPSRRQRIDDVGRVPEACG